MVKSKDKIHRRAIGKTDYESVLNSSEVWALRSVINDQIKSKRREDSKENKFKMIKFLKAATIDQDKVYRKLLKLETEKPFSYVMLSRWTGQLEDVASVVSENQSFSTTSSSQYLSQYKVSYTEKREDSFVFTIEHQIETTRWEWIDGGHFPDEMDVRHPIVFNFFKNGYLFISYPGVTKSRNHPKRFESYYLIEEFMQNNFADLGLNIRAINLQNAINILLDLEGFKPVTFDRLKVGNLDGSVDLSSDEDGFSAENLIPDLMAEHLPGVDIEAIRNAFILALKGNNLSKAALSWRDEKVSTLFSNYNMGTEVHFVWKRSTPSYMVVSKVLKSLINLSENFTGTAEELIDLFYSSSERSYFTFQQLQTRSNLDQKTLWKKLSALCSSGLVRMVYKLKTEEIVPDLDNKWTEDISTIRSTFTTVNGNVVSGLEDKNIEIAFVAQVKKES